MDILVLRLRVDCHMSHNSCLTPSQYESEVIA